MSRYKPVRPTPKQIKEYRETERTSLQQASNDLYRAYRREWLLNLQAAATDLYKTPEVVEDLILYLLERDA